MGRETCLCGGCGLPLSRCVKLALRNCELEAQVMIEILAATSASSEVLLAPRILLAGNGLA
jgi:hypothetical protein